ncbi:nicotinate-nucleotide--dimethylbenzimidazole phosphoribosyltransferase [Treponema endosymbiont of Eucomonympha sp.]|uniref:nicotinate-nucleotide--dimethylbenzimidazole phosphoribosyltransferase n=1 Tax=Treponema endosymbiont of Eucomonympha sp. TaxID=1580831 RepID=UPI0035A0A38D
MKMARIQGKSPPEIRRKVGYAFAGDHGIATDGVSLYPQEVAPNDAEHAGGRRGAYRRGIFAAKSR